MTMTLVLFWFLQVLITLVTDIQVSHYTLHLSSLRQCPMNLHKKILSFVFLSLRSCFEEIHLLFLVFLLIYLWYWLLTAGLSCFLIYRRLDSKLKHLVNFDSNCSLHHNSLLHILVNSHLHIHTHLLLKENLKVWVHLVLVESDHFHSHFLLCLIISSHLQYFLNKIHLKDHQISLLQLCLMDYLNY